MADFTQLKADIIAAVYENTDQEITGDALQGVLLEAVDDINAAKQDEIADLDTIRAGAALGATAYQLPADGIPASDLDAAVQGDLGLAASAYQLPADGIPSTDLDAAVQTSLGKADTAEQVANKVTSIDQDSTDTQYPSAKCVYDIVGDIETLLANI